MKRKSLIMLLLAGIILLAVALYLSDNTLDFALVPPISDELLLAINFTDSSNKAITVKENGWGLSSWTSYLYSDINGIERGIGTYDKLNISEKKKLRETYLNLTKTGRMNMTDPNIFYSYSGDDNSVTIRQFCDNDSIYSTINKKIADRVILALKNYNCSSSADVKLLSIKVPKSAHIINKKTLEYMRNKGAFLQYYEAASGRYVVRFSADDNNVSTSITQQIENYEDYTERLAENIAVTNNSLLVQLLIENKTFKNGYYRSVNYSGTSYSTNAFGNKANWYCFASNSLIDITGAGDKFASLLSFKEMEELSKFLCPP